MSRPTTVLLPDGSTNELGQPPVLAPPYDDSIPDDTLGMLDPDTVETTLRDLLANYGLPNEVIEDIVGNALPFTLMILDDNQPINTKSAIVNISKLMSALFANIIAIQTSMGSSQFEFQNHLESTHDVHGIPDTSILVTQTTLNDAVSGLATQIGVDAAIQIVEESVEALQDTVTALGGDVGTLQTQVSQIISDLRSQKWSLNSGVKTLEGAMPYQVNKEDGIISAAVGSSTSWTMPPDAAEGQMFVFITKEPTFYLHPDTDYMYFVDRVNGTQTATYGPVTANDPWGSAIIFVKDGYAWNVVNNTANYAEVVHAHDVLGCRVIDSDTPVDTGSFTTWDLTDPDGNFLVTLNNRSVWEGKVVFLMDGSNYGPWVMTASGPLTKLPNPTAGQVIVAQHQSNWNESYLLLASPNDYGYVKYPSNASTGVIWINRPQNAYKVPFDGNATGLPIFAGVTTVGGALTALAAAV